jgi:hypothetical protein
MVGMSDRVESQNLEKGNAQLDNSKLYAEARQSFMDAAAGPSVKVERLSTGETAEILTGALARGTFTEGYKEVTEHPGRLAAEGIGGYALMVAMRDRPGPECRPWQLPQSVWSVMARKP